MQQLPPSLALKVELGPATGKVLECTHLKRSTIGRTRANSFQIKDDAISQKHLLIECKDGQWFVEDLGSSNGTSINGINIDEGVPVAVCHDDLLRIGIDTRLRVVLQPATVPQVLPKEKQSSRRSASSQLQKVCIPAHNEQTPCTFQTGSTAKRPPGRRDFAQPQVFSVFKDAIKPTSVKESCKTKSSLRQRGFPQVQSLFRSWHDNAPSKKKTAPKQEEHTKSTEKTLREWFAQEKERIPNYQREKAEETVLEIREHAEELKRAYMISLLSKTASNVEDL
ncbi:hypothetical protein O6H91_08G045600 [Diphasiastrum complanatum]|uniref:Uncharacterized protein n=2 Tax=Diphasiastrum complanatum TaxID=34168 RepID=A0ACC2CXL0_DIPCM|nr:hypothetical protein O6H91_08G045600 [Diphasiastrum complanatum]KAJ7546591.1 hypothetical protein O6H91_08G045600 [Diphasiastrum complanatum]